MPAPEQYQPPLPGTVVAASSLITPGGDIGPAGATGTAGATGPQGPAGPTAISANANNKATLGTDSLLLVQGTAAGIAATTHAQTVSGDDPQLTNARTPTTHAVTHAHGGSDPVTITYSDLAGIPASFTPTAHHATHLTGGSDIIPAPTTSASGLVPPIPNDTTQFLRGDGTFAHDAVSANVGNIATLGTDNLILVRPVTLGGYLKYVSATSLSFLPFRGSQIIINGVVYQIPSAGIVGLANTGIYIDGVAGQNLTASTLYRVYVFNNAGTLTADFSVTAHVTSSTSGNVGTEIKSGDDTRTFIGLIYTTSSNQFMDSAQYRWVRSWVNRKRITFLNYGTGSTSSTSAVALVASNSVLCFADDACDFCSNGYVVNSAVGTVYVHNYLDGAQVDSAPSAGTVPAAGYYMPVSVLNALQIASEGAHAFAAYGYVAAGTMTFYLQLTGSVGG
jgi:hypothetical protein